jgi:primase-polymerase (primpol)-like protein
MNNNFHPWAAPLKAPLPSQKLSPSQDGTVIMKWEEYQAIKKARADEERKSNKRKSNRMSYQRMKNNEEKYKKNKMRKRKDSQTRRAAKKEGVSVKEYINSIKNKHEDAAEVLLSLGKRG